MFNPIIYDTTLREGMQTPGGIGGSLEERVYAANLISRFADYIEVGMPANPVDFGIISAVRDSFEQNGRKTGIAVLCRLRNEEIDSAAEAFRNYQKTLAHIFIGTSEEHRKWRFNGARKKEDYESGIQQTVAHAASKGFSHVMFSPEDSYRTFHESPEDFFDFVNAAIRGYGKRSGNLILNFPDTIGMSTISEFDQMLDEIISKYGESIEISLHGHNDRGTSMQQAVEASINGKARWLQTTFGCLGERNGIAQTEAVIAALAEHGLKKYSKADQKLLVPYTTAILGALGRTIPDEALVSGSRTNVSTAGIHTAIASKSIATYHINGEKYGAKPVMEFGPTSGAEQVLSPLRSIGFMYRKHDKKLGAFVSSLKEQCNAEKRSLTETDVLYYAIKAFGSNDEPLKNIGYAITTKKGKKAAVELTASYDGQAVSAQKEANGPVEAMVGALEEILGRQPGSFHLVQFRPSVVPKIPAKYLAWEKGRYPEVPSGLGIGSDFRQHVGIMNGSGRVYYGFASGEDTFQAIADACTDAVVKMAAIERWEKTSHKSPLK
jgi:2-isopropylmalate synthase